MQSPTVARPASSLLPPFDAHGVVRASARARHPRPLVLDLAAVPAAQWAALHDRAIEPNAYFAPSWAFAVARHARGRSGAQALLAWNDGDESLIGLMPVRSAWQALRLPMPMLVGWSGYASLTVPLLDRAKAAHAAGTLLDAARRSGAAALFLPNIATDGEAFAAFEIALAERGLSARPLRHYRRAGLDARQDGDTALRSALGAKKLKELRRQRHRMEDAGALTFKVSTTPADVAIALESFLALEQEGWKGARGTALADDDGDAVFIRAASTALAAQGRFEVASLTRAGAPIAAGLILRDQDRAFFFKIAVDETELRYSPGVQLTLDITRYLCADPRIAFVDSSADGEHPMIDHVWRERIDIADVFIPLRPRSLHAFAARNLIRARYAAIKCVRGLQRLKEKYT